MSIKKCITKSQSKEDTWPNRYWSVVIFARPRRSQNNPARGSENHAPLHHPLDFAPSHSLSTLFLSLSFWLSLSCSSLPLSSVCSYWLFRTVWAGPVVSRFPTLIVQGARSSCTVHDLSYHKIMWKRAKVLIYFSINRIISIAKSFKLKKFLQSIMNTV